MSENNQKPQSTIDLNPIAANSMGSPKGMYVYFLLALCRNYFETMKDGSTISIDSATAALIAFCPNREKRKELWDGYIKEKSHTNTTTSSVYAVGELVSYLSEVLEFEERSTGGLM